MSSFANAGGAPATPLSFSLESGETRILLASDVLRTCSLSVTDWTRLHCRIRPHPRPLEDFKRIVAEGRLDMHYKAKELQKVMVELRDILQEHGELRCAQELPLTAPKAELAAAAAHALLLLSKVTRWSPPDPCSESAVVLPQPASLSELPGRPELLAGGLRGGDDVDPARCRDERAENIANVRAPPSGHSTMPRSSAGSSTLSGSRAGVGYPRLSLPLARSSASGGGVGEASGTAPSSDGHAEPVTTSPAVSLPGPGALAPAAGPDAGSFVGDCDVRHALATPGPAGPTVHVADTLPTELGKPGYAGICCDPFRRVSGRATESAAAVLREIEQLNQNATPFGPLLHVIRRFQIRFGSQVVRFDIPPQYVASIAARKMRVQVIPLRHPNVPVRWPAAKEMVVYVNDQCVVTPWRRAWPERKTEVSKTYLPLDITQLLVRSPSQRLQIDLFAKEYFSQVLIGVVQPKTETEIANEMIEPFGSATNINTCADEVMQAFYRQVLRPDDDGEEVECAEPVVSTKCPILQSRMQTPVRGRFCMHLQCIDLSSYLVTGNRGCYWNCALCDASMMPSEVYVDTVLWRFLVAQQVGGDAMATPSSPAAAVGSGGDGVCFIRLVEAEQEPGVASSGARVTYQWMSNATPAADQAHGPSSGGARADSARAEGSGKLRCKGRMGHSGSGMRSVENIVLDDDEEPRLEDVPASSRCTSSWSSPRSPPVVDPSAQVAEPFPAYAAGVAPKRAREAPQDANLWRSRYHDYAGAMGEWGAFRDDGPCGDRRASARHALPGPGGGDGAVGGAGGGEDEWAMLGTADRPIEL